jgi:hypothetical protein
MKTPEKVQLDRFKQAAREAECDDTPEAFERVFAKVVRPKKAGEVVPRGGKKPND